MNIFIPQIVKFYTKINFYLNFIYLSSKIDHSTSITLWLIEFHGTALRNFTDFIFPSKQTNQFYIYIENKTKSQILTQDGQLLLKIAFYRYYILLNTNMLNKYLVAIK